MNNINSTKKKLSPEQSEKLIETLKARFEKNIIPPKARLDWAKVQTKLEASPEKLWSLNEMEKTGGEPDVVGHDKKTAEYIFYDCSAESPKGRRNANSPMTRLACDRGFTRGGLSSRFNGSTLLIDKRNSDHKTA